MRKTAVPALALIGGAAVLLAACGTQTSQTSQTGAQQPKGPMSFFITSAGSGKGADLGGLAGADAQCQKLATGAGSSGKTWRAYLSVPGIFPQGNNPGVASINARDRIGKGPWYNAKGDLIARDIAHLHDGNNISKATALDERGNPIKGRGDQPNEHDILTGSRDDGTAFSGAFDTTCGNWTVSGPGSAVVGHHDRSGPLPENWAKSWNFSHHTVGCSQEALVRTGGAGRFYCFAAD